MRVVLLMVLFRALPVFAKPPMPLRVGITTSVNDSRVTVQAEAFAEWVKQATGRETRAEVFPDYDGLANALADGKLDVALMGPLTFLRAEANGKVEPLARAVRAGYASYRAVLFAKGDTPLQDLAAIARAKNLKVGWVDSSSASGHVFPKHLLLTQKIDPAQVFVTQDFAGSHVAVCKGVLQGKWDVGATFTDAPSSVAKPTITGCVEGLGKRAATLHIIATTQDIPSDALVVRADLEPALKKKLRQTALSLASTDAGKQVLSNAFFAESFAAVSVADYEPVRGALDIFKK
ncbi:MAG: phosphate/phosphite/phosphonate ABC transporter substrate-binding protein [Myxococcota bacterium]